MIDFDSAIVVTGGQTGLGFEATRVIAKEKPRALLIISSRSSGEEAASAINKELGQSNVKYIRLDLADLADVRKFAEHVLANKLPISALLLNAGLQLPNGVSYTTDGVETTFGVNHVGHALLFHLLQPHFTENARVVVTSSGTHDPAEKSGLPDAKYVTAELLAHPDEVSKNNDGRQRYSTSKLCNVLWAYALDRHRINKGLTFSVNAFDPGLMPGTGLARDGNAVEKFVWFHILPHVLPVVRLLIYKETYTPQESGRKLAYLAVSPEVEGISAQYHKPRRTTESSKESHDERKQEDLWNWTVEFVGRDKIEVEKFRNLSQQTNA